MSTGRAIARPRVKAPTISTVPSFARATSRTHWQRPDQRVPVSTHARLERIYVLPDEVVSLHDCIIVVSIETIGRRFRIPVIEDDSKNGSAILQQPFRCRRGSFAQS